MDETDYPVLVLPWDVRNAKITIRNAGRSASLSRFAILKA